MILPDDATVPYHWNMNCMLYYIGNTMGCSLNNFKGYMYLQSKENVAVAARSPAVSFIMEG